MIVCVCARVSDKEITRQATQGLDFEDIQLELGVGTQCGQCVGCARELVRSCQTTAAPRAPWMGFATPVAALAPAFA